ncbi:MAG: hypothetical protein RLZZ630_969 [Bacteroidota bacterium]
MQQRMVVRIVLQQQLDALFHLRQLPEQIMTVCLSDIIGDQYDRELFELGLVEFGRHFKSDRKRMDELIEYLAVFRSIRYPGGWIPLKNLAGEEIGKHVRKV